MRRCCSAREGSFRMEAGWEGWEGANQAEERSMGGRERRGEEGERRRVEGERERVEGRIKGSTATINEEVEVRSEEEEGGRTRSSRRSASVGFKVELFKECELTRLSKLS